jgi:uncharacterized protein YdaL
MTMRRRLPRALGGALAGTAAAALLAGAALGGPATPAAAQNGHDHHRRTAITDTAAATARGLPAPPRPPRARPTQRVIAGGGTGGSGRAKPGGTGNAGVADQAAKAAALSTVPAAVTSAVPATTGAGAPGAGTAKTLVVYDATGPYAWLGEAYATLATNLASHFGAWSAHAVSGYTAGEVAGYSAVIYVGSTYDEPVPVAFIDDVLATTVPVVWMYDNIWQLTARQADFATARGFTWRQFDFATVSEVRYHGTALTRDAINGSGIMDTVITDPTRATVLADAVRADGTTFPWAVRSGNLTYLGEIPFAYMTHDDRYLAFSDLLFDALAPATAARHRALVRIEDVGPDADPVALRAVADYLASRKVPFTVAVYPRYRDPKGVNNAGRAEDFTLRQRPLVVSALKYMVRKGGTLLMHGYTHQYSTVANPYDGVSGNDFEFFRAHVDAADNVVYDGPVPGDSAGSASARVTSSFREFLLAGLAKPTMFEFPHYAGSAVDYKAVAARFATRYERGLYYPGVLSATSVDHTRIIGQYFPYLVRDVYGTAVVPENIGNVLPETFNNHPTRFPADLVASARRNLAIRDGVASFFYHPYLGPAYLAQVVEGVQGLGYTFVPASAVLAG